MKAVAGATDEAAPGASVGFVGAGVEPVGSGVGAGVVGDAGSSSVVVSSPSASSFSSASSKIAGEAWNKFNKTGLRSVSRTVQELVMKPSL